MIGSFTRAGLSSWGFTSPSTLLENAIINARNHGQVFVVAAHNQGLDLNSYGMYPANYDLDNILVVGATDNTDNRASFSNYGLNKVDIAAPGVNIYSTMPGNKYDFGSGTSMATPHVTGAIALLLANEPGLSYTEVIQRILATADHPVNLTGDLVGGRLNAYRALTETSASGSGSGTSGGNLLGGEGGIGSGAWWSSPPVNAPLQTPGAPSFRDHLLRHTESAGNPTYRPDASAILSLPAEDRPRQEVSPSVKPRAEEVPDPPTAISDAIFSEGFAFGLEETDRAISPEATPADAPADVVFTELLEAFDA